jgi:hypothetical protein
VCRRKDYLVLVHPSFGADHSLAQLGSLVPDQCISEPRKVRESISGRKREYINDERSRIEGRVHYTSVASPFGSIFSKEYWRSLLRWLVSRGVSTTIITQRHTGKRNILTYVNMLVESR